MASTEWNLYQSISFFNIKINLIFTFINLMIKYQCPLDRKTIFRWAKLGVFHLFHFLGVIEATFIKTVQWTIDLTLYPCNKTKITSLMLIYIQSNKIAYLSEMLSLSSANFRLVPYKETLVERCGRTFPAIFQLFNIIYYYIRLYFTVFLLARSNTRDIPFSNILISKKQCLCNK